MKKVLSDDYVNNEKNLENDFIEKLSKIRK